MHKKYAVCFSLSGNKYEIILKKSSFIEKWKILNLKTENIENKRIRYVDYHWFGTSTLRNVN